MTGQELEHLRGMVEEFVNLYCDLVKVNRRIGIWDMRRHEVCKATIPDIDKAYLVKTERLGRQSVETRARIKTRIDTLYAEIVAYRVSVGDKVHIKKEA